LFRVTIQKAQASSESSRVVRASARLRGKAAIGRGVGTRLQERHAL
jgi:hypothetical protein